jgi:gliding motility-associated-like protein
MKKVLLLILVVSCHSINYGLHVTIIESQSVVQGQVMDEKWDEVVKKLGHTSEILQQSALDNNQFFAGTDVLIVASGSITLPSNRVSTILSFLKTGKPVYIQSEYQRTFPGNMAFGSLVASLGGTFAWKNDFAGDLAMEIIGVFSTSKNTMDYYWFSVSGEGDCNMAYFLKYGNEHHGFQFLPENPAYGNIITTTDQDWVHKFTHPELMEKIVKNLVSPETKLNKGFMLSNDTSLCEGSSLLLDALVDKATYLWQDLSTGPQYLVSKPGLYWVKVTTDNCIMRDTVKVGYLSKPRPDLGNDIILCNGEEMLLEAGPPSYAYLWQDGSTQPDLKVSKAGTYWVQVSNNCGVSTDSIVLKYDSLAKFDLGNDTILCEGSQLTLETKIGNATYLWQDGSANPSKTIHKAGKYSVTLSLGPCKISDTINIENQGIPGDALESFASLCIGKTLTLNPHVNHSEYLWQDNSTDSVFKVKEGGEYWVKISNLCGTYTDKITVESIACNCYIYIPNAFTPDNTQLNDGFAPVVTTCDVVNYNFEVFSSWGQLLYASNQAGNSWDGNYKGNVVPQGVYMYRLQVWLEDGSKKYFSGSFTLMY